ncbi:RxLR-like protein [Plasmopara halstedii]|uniref:RxLR-like protein n=1 Tax=Plasmopara halstedii TaxID=4781 RepID=A0A0P1AQB6_PLAHL|nr:RxLR-like protein [Plasmopara halstedii]CEG43575.1 RxLR-like protein [Plasmopara halstedii]|eukprot:XP_024579944.1 RxLR-like protein [Plasmopara halstedii]
MRLCLQVLCAGIAATLVNAVSLTVEDPTPKALRGASTADVTVDTNRNLATTDVHTETSSENHVSATPKVKKVRENRLWSDDDDSDILSDDFSIDYSDDISDDYSYDSKEAITAITTSPTPTIRL